MSNVKEYLARIKSEENAPEDQLYALLQYCVAATGRGEVDSDYTKRITFPIGGHWLSVDLYYRQVTLEDEEDGMQDLNETEMTKIFKEVKKRLLQFDKKTEESGRKTAIVVFDAPINKKMIGIN